MNPQSKFPKKRSGVWRGRSGVLGPVVVCIVIALLAWLGRALIFTPRCTAFALEGETTTLSFVSNGSEESTREAGLFSTAVPQNLVIVGCSKLSRVAIADQGQPCKEGRFRLQNAAVSSIRIARSTEVHLRVENKSLSITLLDKPSDSPSLITISATPQSINLDTNKPLAAGSWNAYTKDPAQKLIFERAHLAAEDEGDQQLADSTAIRLESEGSSGFMGDTAVLLLPDLTADQSKILLSGSRVQVNALHHGYVRTLTPVLDKNGDIEGLRIKITGASNSIEVFNPFKDSFENRSLSTVDQLSGNAKLRLFAMFVFIAGVLSAIQNLYSIRKTHLDLFGKKRANWEDDAIC